MTFYVFQSKRENAKETADYKKTTPISRVGSSALSVAGSDTQMSPEAQPRVRWNSTLTHADTLSSETLLAKSGPSEDFEKMLTKLGNVIPFNEVL